MPVSQFVMEKRKGRTGRDGEKGRKRRLGEEILKGQTEPASSFLTGLLDLESTRNAVDTVGLGVVGQLTKLLVISLWGSRECDLGTDVPVAS